MRMAQLVLPHIAPQLVTLDLLGTRGAQGMHLLRTSTPDGVLPALRSLGIQISQYPPLEEGATDANVFDAFYLESIARTAPRLEELELLGPSSDEQVRASQVSSPSTLTSL